MKPHRLLTITCAAFFVAFLAAGCSRPAPDAPDAAVGDAIEEAPPIETPPAEPGTGTPEPTADAPEPEAAAGPERYIFSGDSYIGFAGSKSVAGVTVGTHYGQFLQFDGAVTVPEGNLEAAKVELTIETNGIQTDNSILTNTLKNENFFNVEEFPHATFNTTSIAPADGDTYTVTGNLTIRGVSKSVSFPASITLDGDTLAATSEFRLNRKDWGIGEGWTQSVINDHIVMQLDVEAMKTAVESITQGQDPFSQPREGSEPK